MSSASAPLSAPLAVRSIRATEQRLDALICNAGFMIRKPIADLSLDVLFWQDIGMDPLSYLLAFARLSPVQLTSFGHPDTTGIPNMDYFLSSSFYEMPGAADDYSEQLVLLEGAGTLSYYYPPAVPEARLCRAGDWRQGPANAGRPRTAGERHVR